MLPKSRARLTAVLATVVALAASVLAVQQMMPASAVAPAPSAPVFVAPENLIQGVVVDQRGRAVDDVTVEAVKADGTNDAADKTYEASWEGGPGHGYFALSVHRGGYTLVLSKPGYRTVGYDAGLVTKRRKTISMGEIEIQKVAAPTRTEATLAKATITTKNAGSVAVTVTDPADKKAKVAGDVEVREGKKVVGTATIGRKGGAVTVTLAKLPKGAHTLTAYYLGSADHRSSGSKGLTLTVVKRNG